MTTERRHRYDATVTWTGNLGHGTVDYRHYSRNAEITVTGKPSIPLSSDPAFLGDPHRHNPEELLVASLAACHMLWYLHLCANAGIRVTSYQDQARGTMIEDADGGGRFHDVILRPHVTLAHGSDVDLARRLHAEANLKCFIANSLNFPVHHDPHIIEECSAAAEIGTAEK